MSDLAKQNCMSDEFHSDRSQEVIGDVLREIANGHGPESVDEPEPDPPE